MWCVDVFVCVVYVCGESLFGEGVNGVCVFVCFCVYECDVCVCLVFV